MAPTLQSRIADALSRVRHPRTGIDLLSAEAVRDVATTTSGKVRLTLLLARGDDPSLALTVRRALENVEGVSEVTIDVGEAEGFAPNKRAPGRALPVMEQQRPAQRV